MKRIKLARGRSGIITATLWETRWWTDERYLQVEFGREVQDDISKDQPVLTRFSGGELVEVERLAGSARRVIQHYRRHPGSRPTHIFDAVPYELLTEEEGWELLFTSDMVPGTTL